MNQHGDDETVAFEDHHERIERRRVFGEPLARVECEERDVPSARLCEHATRDALFGGAHK